MPPFAPTAFVLLALAAACTPAPRARPVVGPDGSAMTHVSCGSDQGACFQLAGQSCPSGYRLFPIFDPHSNNYLVRCTAPVGAVARQRVPAPPARHAPAREASDGWPPVAEAWVPADPWPAAVMQAPPALSGPSPEEVDLGY